MRGYVDEAFKIVEFEKRKELRTPQQIVSLVEFDILKVSDIGLEVTMKVGVWMEVREDEDEEGILDMV